MSIASTLQTFVNTDVIPSEPLYEAHISQFTHADRWTHSAVPPILAQLQSKAQRLHLWNLFLPHPLPQHLLELNATKSPPISIQPPNGTLTNLQYAPLAEIMGSSPLASESCNCSAPDTGNMEVLLKFGSVLQQTRYLLPLLRGEIRSAFLMTEPNVSSSDARNLTTLLEPATTGNRYVLNGKKWWSTGAMDPRCNCVIIVAKTHPSLLSSSEQQRGGQSIIVLPLPHPGIRLIRPLTVFGYDDAPHGHAEVELVNVQVREEDIVLGLGRGFQIAQERLGPGRIHHCMRAIGLVPQNALSSSQAARCYELMLQRTLKRSTFSKPLHAHGSVRDMIADSATDLETARLLTLACAKEMDERGNRHARDKIAMIKVAVPQLTSRVVDRAVQIFGGAGVCDDFPLARALVGLRTLRIADGPDEVHKQTLALIEIKKAKQRMQSKL
ncbi:hypothetical protein ACHAWO_006445 [Cyclotella atomus]|uniref:Acyl-CoA dehydrogenase n=1 Tax=Cyclotella atomus TaxID=382360 RepID=A0ABD3NZA4_9STRA